MQQVPNYLVWAILTTLFCCLPFGIVSIVNAAKVDGLVASGNIRAALDASASAKRWAQIAAVCGAAVLVIYIVIIVIVAVAAHNTQPQP